MKWLRILCAAAVFAVVSCQSPTVPKYPEPDEEEDDPTDPGNKNGFLVTPTGEVTFWV
jgi:hypothetical protein